MVLVSPSTKIAVATSALTTGGIQRILVEIRRSMIGNPHRSHGALGYLTPREFGGKRKRGLLGALHSIRNCTVEYPVSYAVATNSISRDCIDSGSA